MPDIPTVIEGGLPAYETSACYGMDAPPGTPVEIASRIQCEIARIANLPEVRERLTQLGAEPVANTPEEFAAFARAEYAKYEKLIKQAGMKPE